MSQSAPSSGMSVNTRTCPFCKEQVRADATKCRYCGSYFEQPAHSKKYGADKVIYVVDRDIVRFGKFAIAILGLATVMGLYLFGIDVKKTRLDLETAQVRLTELQDHLGESLVEFRRTEVDVQQAARAVATNSKLARDALDRILETQQKVATVYTSLVRMQDGSLGIMRETLVTATGTPSPHAGTRKGDLWPIGTTIRVAFLGGHPDDHMNVRQWAGEWMNYANIQFEFVSDLDADVRVSFEPDGGSWSLVGTKALDAPKQQPTMNLGWVGRDNVLHEFGHVLGLLHETANPNNDIPWDKEAVYQALEGAPNFWTRSDIRKIVFETYPPDHFPARKPFDPKSIMMHTFPSSYVSGKYVLGGAGDISPMDQEFIGALYPRS